MRSLIPLALLFFAGCASQAPNPGSNLHAAAATAPAPTALVPASTTSVQPPATAAQVSAAQIQLDAAVKKALSQGYRLSNKNSVKTYCQEQTPLGTRFSRVVCYTPEQLTSIFAAEDQTRDKVKSMGASCVGTGACNAR